MLCIGPLFAFVDLVLSLTVGPPLNSILAKFCLPILFFPSIVGVIIVVWTVNSVRPKWQIVAALDSIDEVNFLGSLIEGYGVDDVFHLTLPSRPSR